MGRQLQRISQRSTSSIASKGREILKDCNVNRRTTRCGETHQIGGLAGVWCLGENMPLTRPPVSKKQNSRGFPSRFCRGLKMHQSDSERSALVIHLNRACCDPMALLLLLHCDRCQRSASTGFDGKPQEVCKMARVFFEAAQFS